MANFLNTLRAWGESLFNGKGAWASAQAFPSTGDRIELTNGSTEYQYVAPSDGYFAVFMDNSNFADIYTTRGGALFRKTSWRSSNSTTSSGTIPVSKGDIVHYISNVAPTEMWFMQSAGSV